MKGYEYSDFNRLSSNARKSTIISEIISIIIFGAIAFAVRAAFCFFEAPDKVIFIVTVVCAVVISIVVIYSLLEMTVGFKRKKYRINEESIEYISGILFVSHTVVPIRRMQQVDIEEGPINRLFKLAEVNLITAGGKLTIELLEKEKAETIVSELKALINKFAKEQKDLLQGGQDNE